jgi:hypothetical protein
MRISKNTRRESFVIKEDVESCSYPDPTSSAGHNCFFRAKRANLHQVQCPALAKTRHGIELRAIQQQRAKLPGSARKDIETLIQEAEMDSHLPPTRIH